MLFAGALYPQWGSVKGIVYDDATGQPLPGVTVKMMLAETSQFHLPSPVTDKEGKWSAAFLRNGMWNLEFDKPGYAPQVVSWKCLSRASSGPPPRGTS